MERDVYWLAGLLEGEGSFLAPVPSAPNRPIISLQMTDLDIMDRVAVFFNTKVYRSKKQKEHHKQSYFLHIRGKKAVEWMKKLFPLMGKRRQSQIMKAIALYISTNRNRRLSNHDVKNIRHECQLGTSISSLSRQYGISRYAIRLIRDKKTYSDVD